jgi:glutaconate CoA-transferase, subunit B
MNYSPIELMIVCASHALEDGKTVAVGTGVPCAAAMLAQKTHAPNLVIFFEAGGVAPQLPTMPISVGDSRTIHKALMATSMADVMQFCQKGLMDYTFLSGAQIDPFGNLNSTMIGKDYQKPKVRLPGSGGANDLASFCWRTLIIMRHDAKKFVEKLDFLTSPGFLTGPGAREAAGLPKGTGPYRVITELAVLGFHPESKRMMLLSLHPGQTLKQVQDATGFKLEIAENVGTTRAPTEDELRLLREEVDPLGYVLRRAG